VSVATAHKVGDPLAFYEVAATVIPVLFLALVYQTKTFQTDSAQYWAVRSSVAMLAVWATGVGEITALHVLERQEHTLTNYRVTAISLVVLAAGVIPQPALMLGAILNRHPEEPAYFRPVYFGIIGGGAGLLAAYAVLSILGLL
jgi:hypothetical protein